MRTRNMLIITLPNTPYAPLYCTYNLYRNAAGIGGESGVFRPSHSAKELTMIQPFHFSNETASGTAAHSSKTVLLSREVSYSSITVALPYTSIGMALCCCDTSCLHGDAIIRAPDKLLVVLLYSTASALRLSALHSTLKALDSYD
jgi:hypothetical protein